MFQSLEYHDYKNEIENDLDLINLKDIMNINPK